VPFLVDAIMIQISTALVEPVVTPHGVLRTRPEAEGDAEFLFTLYESVKGPEMASMPVDDHTKRQLLSMQFQAMTRGYRAAFPAARYDVILLDETCIGRLIINVEPGRAHVVYIALLAEWRNRGIGVALMTSVLAEPRRLGVVFGASVARDNTASLRLWNKLGFEERERTAMDVILERRTA
jgi:ribosomal protein S18 acetylase RimI-like enzyme